MKCRNIIYKFLIIFILLLVSVAQNNKIMVAYATQNVEEDTLHIDIYIKRLTTEQFSLGSANFSLYLNSNALDLSNAELVEIGPWSLDTTPSDYSGPDYLYKDNFFTVNILPITSSMGTGVVVDTSYIKVCRVSIPILDPSAVNTLQWRVSPIAIHKWTYEEITDSVLFLLGNSTVDLCFTPEVPVVSAPTDVSCQNITIHIDSSNATTYEIYKDGNLISTITSDSFVVSSTGSYYVVAKNYSCSSGHSNVLDIKIEAPLVAPVITLSGDSLICNNCEGQDLQTYQWFFNGNPIAGANKPYIKNLSYGTYQLKIINSCGEEMSNTFVFLPTNVSINIHGTKIVAYPVPTDNELNILLSGNPDTKIKLSLFNILGEKTQDIYNGKLENKVQHLKVNTTNLSSGVYFIKGNISNEPVSIKIVITH